MDLSISDAFRACWPTVQLSCIECNVQPVLKHEALWELIVRESRNIREGQVREQISQQAAIAASRKVYRALGKDPARYRLSAEALMRRVVKGEELYQINSVVDLVNFSSISSGFSIGAYDADKIEGPVVLGVGKEHEPYEAIGRGELNVENLPVLRDASGAFGSPTSDSLRTSVTLGTRHLLMVFFGFGAFNTLDDALKNAASLLYEFAGAQNLEHFVIQ